MSRPAVLAASGSTSTTSRSALASRAVGVAHAQGGAAGPVDDPGRPTIRVGYAELRVTPEVKRLAVTPSRSAPNTARPTRRACGCGARPRGRGARSEVTLWAVDEGVLSLTGYRTPDPIDLIYRARGLGMRLASNLTSVAPQMPEGEKGRREAGGGGGAEGADVLRSRFKTTAFFLGSVVTDANGDAVAVAKLPDNLTTFRRHGGRRHRGRPLRQGRVVVPRHATADRAPGATALRAPRRRLHGGRGDQSPRRAGDQGEGHRRGDRSAAARWHERGSLSAPARRRGALPVRGVARRQRHLPLRRHRRHEQRRGARDDPHTPRPPPAGADDCRRAARHRRPWSSPCPPGSTSRARACRSASAPRRLLRFRGIGVRCTSIRTTAPSR